MAPLLERMPPERPRVCPASVRHGSWRATILPCLLAGRDDAAMSDLRVVLAEDDVLLREGLASLLQRSGFEVAGQAGDAKALLAAVRGAAPPLVIADIRMPPPFTTEGLEAAQTIRRQQPETAILLLSAHVEVEQA